MRWSFFTAFVCRISEQKFCRPSDVCCGVEKLGFSPWFGILLQERRKIFRSYLFFFRSVFTLLAPYVQSTVVVKLEKTHHNLSLNFLCDCYQSIMCLCVSLIQKFGSYESVVLRLYGYPDNGRIARCKKVLNVLCSPRFFIDLKHHGFLSLKSPLSSGTFSQCF